MGARIWLTNAASAASVSFVRFVARLMPHTASAPLGSALGSLAYALLRSRRSVALDNIRFVFGSEVGDERVKGIAKAAFRNLGKSAVEFLNLPRISARDLARKVRFEGEEHLKAALARGNGVVYLTAHFGNWELMGAALSSRGYPLTVIAREQSDYTTDRTFEEIRRSVGIRVLEEKASVRAALRTLRRNGILGILADQNARSGAVFVPFFGKDAATAPGAAVLAMRTNAAVVPAYIVRGVDDTHTVHIEPEIALQRSGDFEADVAANTREFVLRLEEWIRLYPDHWLWLHKRWKTRPASEASEEEFASLHDKVLM
jgi:KDO2-lipid IV(A) lauroyltransferase